ncbi:hypothetical protein HZC53_04880 [Candidatus Uhrbacteria bacterium]|nr:hypothetical protein [Candidatus Uhrbacteria bacterium]
MKKISETAARQLLAQKAQLIRSRDFHAKRYAELGIDHPNHLASFAAEIREIDTELVRRAMRYEDEAVTLPQHMIDAIQRGEYGDRSRTVFELMVEWNLLVEGKSIAQLDAFGILRLTRILEEVELRVLEVEDFHAEARRGFLERIQAS